MDAWSILVAGHELQPWQLAAAIVALIAAGTVQGSTGFGFNMLAAPVLAVMTPAFVPGPMLFVSLLVSISGMVREWSKVDFSGLSTALAGRLLASVLAVLCIGLLDADLFSLMFGAMVLLAVAISFGGVKIRPTPPTLFCAGFLSGFMGTLTSIGAPPIAMAFHNVHGAVMRSTLNSFFVVGALFSIIMLIAGGHFGIQQLLLGLAMCPFAFAGFFFSRLGRNLVDAGWARPIVLTTSALSGLFLIAQTVL